MDRVLGYLQRHGITRTVHRAVHKLCNRVLQYNAFDVVWLALPSGHDSNVLAPDGCALRKLTPDEAFEFSRLPGTGMGDEHVVDALARGDECLAIDIAGEPACVCWYARKGPVALYQFWDVGFSGDSVYVHGVYTIPKHRGKRLVERNLRAAVTRYAASGATSMFALIESSNYASLKAFHKAGYLDRDTILTARMGKHFFTRHSPECRDARVAIVPRREVPASPAKENISHAA